MFILSVGWRSVFNVNRCLTRTSQAFIQRLPRTATTAACILSRQSWWGWCINYLHPLPSSVCVSSLPASWLWPVLWPLWVMRCLVWRLSNNKHFLVFLNFTSILCSSFCWRLCVTVKWSTDLCRWMWVLVVLHVTVLFDNSTHSSLLLFKKIK